MNKITAIIPTGNEAHNIVDAIKSVDFADEIKKAILEIQNSAKIQNTMIEKGFEYAQNFTDDKIAINIMGIYTSIDR